jgi:hypothetical protein
MKKQLPERYAKIWQYLVDDKQTVNKGRISGMIEEIFISRLGDTKDLLKNNIKSMKIRNKFDLRNDGWQKEVIGAWRRLSLPEIIDEVTTLKQIPDIKKRSPKMQQWLDTIGVATSPLHILTVMEDEYVHGADPHDGGDGDDVPLPPVDEDDGPGFLRRAASGAGAGAKAVLGAAGAGLLGATMRHGGVLAPIAGAGIAAFGLARSIKKGMTSGGSKISTGPKSMFGSGRKSGTPRAKQTDFTPREEELEGGGIKGVLERIEANTAALLEKFGGKAAKDKKDGGILSGLFGAIGPMLAKIFAGPAMLLAMKSLGAAMAAAFAVAAGKYLCNKFPSLCSGPGGIDPEQDQKFYDTQEAILEQAKIAVEAGTASPFENKLVAWDKGRVKISDLSSETESRGDYSAANPDPAGTGWSYGKYQFFSRKKGDKKEQTPNEGLKTFLKDSGYDEHFKGLDVGSPKFAAKWKELSDTDPAFKKAQDKAAETQFYRPVQDAFTKQLGQEPGRANFGLDSAMFASSIQSSLEGNKHIISNVKESAGGKNAWRSMSDQDQINLYYKERKDYVKKALTKEVKLGNMPQKTLDNVMRNLDTQQAKALTLKNSPLDTTPPTTPKISPEELNDQNYLNDAQFMLKERAGESIEHQQAAQKSLRDIYYPTTPKAPGITPPEIKNDKSSQAPTAPIMVSQNNTNAGGGGGGRAGHYNKDESLLRAVIESTVLA